MCLRMQPELSVDVSVEHIAAVAGAVPTHRKILLKVRLSLLSSMTSHVHLEYLEIYMTALNCIIELYNLIQSL